MMNNNYEEIRMIYTDLDGSDFEVDYTIQQPDDKPEGFTEDEAVAAICRAANALLTSLGISGRKLCVHTTSNYNETRIYN